MRPRPALIAVTVAAVAFACSSSDSSEPPPPPDPPAVDDTDASAPAPPPPPPPKPKDAGVDAPHVPQPYPTVESRGGTVIKVPHILPITFASDPFAPSIEDFFTKLAASSYWSTVTGEYGIGPIELTMPIRVDEMPATLDDTQVQTWLQNKFATDARFSLPFVDTLYAIFYPQGVGVTLKGETSCSQFGGYHSETIVGSVSVAYSVVPHCGGGFTQYDLDLVTSAAAHEAVEWATDPFPFTKPAYARMDDDHWIWTQVLLGELADMCFTGGNDIYARPTDMMGYLVQRTWSDAQSNGGHDPCVPHIAGSEPFFTAIPQLPDTYDLIDGVDIRYLTTQALQVPVGMSKTIDLKLHADAPTSAPWNVRVVDLAQIPAGAPAEQTPTGNPEFTFALDKTSGSDGDVLKLTVTSVKATSHRYGGFVIISSLGQDVHVWPALLYNK